MTAHRAPFASRAAAVVVAGLLPLALSACGASRDAQTYQERNSADASNTAVGPLALRGIAVVTPRGGAYEAGSDAIATITVTNDSAEPDELLEVTTPAAEEVVTIAQNRPATLRVPPLGSTGDAVTLALIGLTEDLLPGTYITMTFRFREAGTIEVPVPVQIPEESDRPVYTAEPGDDHEPALQAPAGGHHGEEHGDSAEGSVDGEQETEGIAGVDGEAEAQVDEGNDDDA